MLYALIALMQTLFYLAAVPLHLAVLIQGAPGPRLAAGLAPFSPAAAARRARRALKAPPKPKKARHSGGRAALRTLFKARKDAEILLTGQVALGDAAATALACGALNGLGAALRGALPRLRVDVRPDFSASDVRAVFRGMIRLRAGQIMLALFRAEWELVKGRFFPWKGNRSRAS